MQYSAVQYSAVQYSAVQYSIVQYSTVQYSTVHHSIELCNAMPYHAIQRKFLSRERSHREEGKLLCE